MTRSSIREYSEAVRGRYLRASKKEKGRILDEFTKVVGCHRKAAIRLLRRGNQPRTNNRRGHPRQYGAAVVGDEVNHGTVWSWVQKSEKAPRKEEDRKRGTMFEDGEVFEGEGEKKEIVVTEMDATLLHSQEKERKKLTVKLGIMY